MYYYFEFDSANAVYEKVGKILFVVRVFEEDSVIRLISTRISTKEERQAYQMYAFARMQKFVPRFMNNVLTPETIEKLSKEHLLSDSELKQIRNLQNRADILFDNNYHRGLIEYNMAEARKQIMKVGDNQRTTTKLKEFFEENGRDVYSYEEFKEYGSQLESQLVLKRSFEK